MVVFSALLQLQVLPSLKPVCIIDGPGLTFPTVGSNIIVETFFLHDRGKCFVIYTCCILLGTVAASTFSGFVVETASWTIQFWYNVGLEGVVAILCLVFLDETGWTRPGGDAYPIPPSSFLPRKLATYAFTRRLMPHSMGRQIACSAILPILIGLCPVSLLIGLALMIYFAWGVAVTTLLSVFLQSPLAAGGYGWSPKRNAAFTFVSWFAVLVAQVYG